MVKLKVLELKLKSCASVFVSGVSHCAPSHVKTAFSSVSYTNNPSSVVAKPAAKLVFCAVVKRFNNNPFVVPVKSNEAFAFGVSVPIPTLKGFVAPPKTIVLSLAAVAAEPNAYECIPDATADLPMATDSLSVACAWYPNAML